MGYVGMADCGWRMWHRFTSAIRHPPSYIPYSCLMLVFIGIVEWGCNSYSKEQEQEMQRIREMVTADPASINLPDKTGNTPLHVAVINNYLPLMDWLKAHGADQTPEDSMETRLFIRPSSGIAAPMTA